MLLAVDIGNTNINFGVFKGKGLIKRISLPTQGYTIRSLRKSLGRIEVNESIICSVVPAATRSLKRDLSRLLNNKPLVLGENIKAPVRNLYRRPNQVGQDRLVNAYAGIQLFGAPLIIVDFGTAITFDVISGNKEYLGGLILPGLTLSLDALTERTALLPRIKPGKPREFIGRDTGSSILSGVVYGFAAATDDLTKRIRGKLGKKTMVIATGGNIDLIKGYCQSIDRIDRDLTLKGLNLIYQNSS